MSENEAFLPTKHFRDCYRNIRHFLWGVERVKCFVNVDLHCIVSQLWFIREMEKNSLFNKKTTRFGELTARSTRQRTLEKYKEKAKAS